MPATSHEPISGQLQQPLSNVNKRPPPPSVQDPLRKIFLFWNFALFRFPLPALSRHPREPPGNVRIKQHGRSRVPLQHTKAARGGPAICSSPSQSVPLSPARRCLCGVAVVVEVVVVGKPGGTQWTARATGPKAATNLQHRFSCKGTLGGLQTAVRPHLASSFSSSLSHGPSHPTTTPTTTTKTPIWPAAAGHAPGARRETAPCLRPVSLAARLVNSSMANLLPLGVAGQSPADDPRSRPFQSSLAVRHPE